ncbi:MAG: hypothetical protein QG567_2505, partial [Campylobacterota bacterium]|nr:hypothetical protein [Campylobacterota bacterium]
MPASITTVLELDDKNLKSKLESVSKYYKETYSEWAKATEKVSLKSKDLADQKQKLATAVSRLNEEIKKDSSASATAIAKLKKEIDGRKEHIKVLNAEKSALAASASAQRIELGLNKSGMDYLQKQISSKKEATRTIDEHAKSTENLANTTIRYLRWAGTIAGVVYAANRAWDATLGTGLQVNKMMEDNTSGIAALLSANTQMVLSNGKAVDSYQKFAMGQSVAKETMEQLRIASIKTYATFPQLTEIFQQAIGQTLGMGDSFGKTTDDIIQNTVKLSQRMSNIAGAIGMPMDRVREEIRSLLSGNVSTDSLISTMIFGSPSQANQAINDAKKRGENGVKELLDKMLKPFDALENVESYTKNLLALQDAWSQTMAKMAEPIFSDLKAEYKDLAQTITTNQKEIVESFNSFYEGSKQAIEILDDLAVAVTAYYGTKGIIGIYGKANTALETMVNWTTVYDAKTRTATTSLQGLGNAAKALYLANPFAVWATGIATVIAGVYKLQRISEKLSGERFTEGVKGSISTTSGELDETSKKEDIDAVLKSYEAQITARAKILATADKESEIYRRHLEAMTLINDEMIRLNQIQDGTASKNKVTVELGKLVTQIPVNAETLKDATNYVNKSMEDTLRLTKEIDEINKDIEQRKKRQEALPKTAEYDQARKDIQKEISIEQNAIAEKQKEIAETKSKNAKKSNKQEEQAYKLDELRLRVAQSRIEAELKGDIDADTRRELQTQLVQLEDRKVISAWEQYGLALKTTKLKGDAKTEEILTKEIALNEAIGDLNEKYAIELAKQRQERENIIQASQALLSIERELANLKGGKKETNLEKIDREREALNKKLEVETDAVKIISIYTEIKQKDIELEEERIRQAEQLVQSQITLNGVMSESIALNMSVYETSDKLLEHINKTSDGYIRQREEMQALTMANFELEDSLMRQSSAYINADDATKALIDETQKAKKEMLELKHAFDDIEDNKIKFEIDTSGLDGTIKSLAELGKASQIYYNNNEDFKKKEIVWNKRSLKAQEDFDNKWLDGFATKEDEEKAWGELNKQNAEINQERQTAEIAGYASLAGAMSQYAEDGSTAAKALGAAQSALALINLVQGISTQSKLPFPMNIVAMAATASAGAGYLSQIGQTLSSNSESISYDASSS